jgi:hypothetical protein
MGEYNEGSGYKERMRITVTTSAFQSGYFLLCVMKLQQMLLVLWQKRKILLLFNETSCHEAVWGRESITPRILNIGAIWRCVVSFTSHRINPGERDTKFPIE